MDLPIISVSLDPNHGGTGDLPARTPVPPQPWWNRLVQCNPFYLLSALLLIYGIYRVSVDPHFLSTENRQVIFNFGSLQVYGAMLVATAVLLASKRISYDSTLLVALENILVLIPFMLVSHAAFLSQGLSWTICLIGSAMAIGKFGAFKKGIAGLNLPFALLAVGLVILCVNVTLPLLFRRGLEFGEKVWTNNELWAVRSQYCWYIALPLLASLGHLLPRSEPRPGAAPHEKHWLPLMMFGLWITGTTVHLYTIGYVDDQKFKSALLAPLVWSGSWLLCTRARDFLAGIGRSQREKILFLPAISPCLAFFGGPPALPISLVLLNASIFALIYWRNTHLLIAARLSGLSAIAALLAVPDTWIHPVISDYSRSQMIFALTAGFGLFHSFRVRTAKGGLLGLLCLGILILGALRDLPHPHHIALQASMTYFLLHSLRWVTPWERGSSVALLIAAAVWLMHSILLQQQAILTFTPMIAAGVALLTAVLARLWLRSFSLFVCVTALAALMVKPLYLTTIWSRSAPAGIMALLASFVLFAAGTGFALWKTRFRSAQGGLPEPRCD